jgi:8-oxo-dGTP pyrophosphatase MutT (NUDIX family)
VKQQASKEVVVAALITNEAGEYLVVSPEHKNGWIFPGGYVEVGEAPSSACKREMLAELGIEFSGPERLLSIDYRGHLGEYIMFIFDGGVFTAETIASIKLPPTILEYRFVTADEAMKILRPNSARRLKSILESKHNTGVAYMENQELF